MKTQKELNNHRLNNPELSFLTITKNPYSWLLSLHRRPYHQKIDRNLSFEQFLQSKWTTLKRDNSAPVLNSPIELWNKKNRSYLNLDKKRTLNTTSEDIFKDPANLFEKISSHLHIEKNLLILLITKNLQKIRIKTVTIIAITTYKRSGKTSYQAKPLISSIALSIKN